MGKTPPQNSGNINLSPECGYNHIKPYHPHRPLAILKPTSTRVVATLPTFINIPEPTGLSGIRSKK